MFELKFLSILRKVFLKTFYVFKEMDLDNYWTKNFLKRVIETLKKIEKINGPLGKEKINFNIGKKK